MISVVALNPILVQRQNLTNGEQAFIQRLHHCRFSIERRMESETNIATLQSLYRAWQRNQFHLQEVWKFDLDADYHQWWYVPQCTCPKIDNDERWPCGKYVTDKSCKIHGEQNET